MDWDQAYSNVDHVAESAQFPARWAAQAAAFRAGMGVRADLDAVYGDMARERFDLFMPEGAASGLAVFVHGGYWMRLDKSTFSHFASGALACGWAVAVLGYSLCPDVRLRDITGQIAAALGTVAGRVAGPIALAGHSAGGQLVTRMVCEDVDLPRPVADRVARVLSISGVHDLRPLMRTRMNKVLGLDEAEAKAESPALARPREGARVICCAGGAELPEFRRQNALLANIWAGLGADTECWELPGKNHFTVIEPLADPESALTRAWLGL